MKRKKTLLILGGLLVVLCGVIAAEKLIQRHEDSIQSIEEEVLAIDQEGITEVSWKYEDANLDFVKKDNIWYSADDEAFPVDQEAMSDFLDHFASVNADFIIEDVTDFDQYGLENPECTVNITTEDVTTTVKFGNFSTMDNQRYMCIGDSRVFLIEDDLVAYFVTSRDDLMANDQLQYFDQLEEITVAGEDNLEICYEPDAEDTYTDTYQYFLVDGEEHLALSRTNVDAYLENLTGSGFTDYVTYTADEDALAEYGLDEPELTITVSGKYDPDEEDTAASETTTDAAVEDTASVNTDNLTDGSYMVSIGLKDGDKDNAYLLVDGSSIIYKISIDTYNNLATGEYNTLRPTAVEAVDWSTVDSMDLTIDGETYTAEADNSGETQTWAWDEATAAKAAADSEAAAAEEATETEGTKTSADTENTSDSEEDAAPDFSTVITALDALNITEFNEKTPTKALEYTVTLHLEKEAYPTVTIDVYQYDGDFCLVLFNGETLGLVDRSSAVDLQEAINSLVLGI